MSKKWSLSGLSDTMRRIVRRFPVVLSLLVALTVFLVLNNESVLDGADRSLMNMLRVFFGVSPLLALAMRLYAERRSPGVRSLLLQGGALLVWLGTSALLFATSPMSSPTIIAIPACIAVVLALLFIVPFGTKPSDVCRWNLLIDFLRNGVLAVGVAAVLMGGLALLLTFFEELFGVYIRPRWYSDLIIVGFCFFAPVFFLALLPGKEKIQEDVPRYQTPFLRKTVHYVLFPIVLSYLVLLYVYAARILVTWTLPDGMVSLPVTVLMLGMLVVVVLIYPTQFDGNQSRTDAFILHWLPLAVMPLLVLMTVALGRRLADYGITVSRLYLLVFNVWCYVVCFGLYRIRSRRFSWIVVSFALVFFFCSVGPQSLSKVAQRQLRSEVVGSMARCKAPRLHLPLNKAGISSWRKQVGEAEFDRMTDKLSYLRDFYGESETNGLVADWDNLMDVLNGDFVVHILTFQCAEKMELSALPTHYRYFEGLYGRSVEVRLDKNNLFVLTFAENEDTQRPSFSFSLPMEQLKQMTNQKKPPLLRLRSGEAELVCWNFYCSIAGDGHPASTASLEGLLFYN